MDFLAAVYAQTAEPGRPRLLNAADLAVSPGAAGPVVSIPGGLSFPVIDVLAEMLLDVFMDAFELVPRAAYQPRIAVDRLVIVRESWRFEAAQIEFAQLRDEAARFAAGRRWRRAAQWPCFTSSVGAGPHGDQVECSAHSDVCAVSNKVSYSAR
jgi:hypothetical protein